MNQMCHWGQAPLALVESCYNGSHFQVPKGTDPNGTCKKCTKGVCPQWYHFWGKEYQRGLSPMALFLILNNYDYLCGLNVK